MQLSITVKGPGAEVVSYLIAKNPNNLYERGEKGLTVRLVYPKFTSEEVQFLIYVKTDPVDLVKNSSDFYDITHYINDREFAASSIFVSSIRKALGTALNGKPAEEYAPWVEHPFEMELTFGPIATDLSNRDLEALFAPMGYTIKIVYGESFLSGKSSARFITLLGETNASECTKAYFDFNSRY